MPQGHYHISLLSDGMYYALIHAGSLTKAAHTHSCTDHCTQFIFSQICNTVFWGFFLVELPVGLSIYLYMLLFFLWEGKQRTPKIIHVFLFTFHYANKD
jgi:hypothetical protein